MGSPADASSSRPIMRPFSVRPHFSHGISRPPPDLVAKLPKAINA